MIRLPRFEFQAPASLPDAAEILRQTNGAVRILAGGTDLLVGLKQGTIRPTWVLWLGKIKDLRRIEYTASNGFRIGSMVTLDEIEHHPDILRRIPSLARTVRSIASPQIRNSATIGGNLCLNTRCMYYDRSEFWRGALGYCLKFGDGICHAAPERQICSAVFTSDLAPLLIALDASVRVMSTQGSRVIKLAELYRDDGAHHLAMEQDELLAEVLLPESSMHVHAAHTKLCARGAIDFPVANAAVSLRKAPGGICVDAKVVLGAVHTTPVEVRAAETVLIGKEISEERIEEASEEAAASIHPIPNLIEAVSYRKKMMKVLVKRALREAEKER